MGWAPKGLGISFSYCERDLNKTLWPSCPFAETRSTWANQHFRKTWKWTLIFLCRKLNLSFWAIPNLNSSLIWQKDTSRKCGCGRPYLSYPIENISLGFILFSDTIYISSGNRNNQRILQSHWPRTLSWHNLGFLHMKQRK